MPTLSIVLQWLVGANEIAQKVCCCATVPLRRHDHSTVAAAVAVAVAVTVAAAVAVRDVVFTAV